MDRDFDIDSDPDTTIDLIELNQLKAVLREDFQPSKSQTSQLSDATIATTSSSNHSQEYAKIQAALELNELTNQKLQRLEKLLQDRLRECRQKLRELQGMAIGEKPITKENFRYVNCGKPYFKDENNFPAPDNADTILMKQSQMYDFSYITCVPGWTVKDKSQFMALLQKMSQEIKKNELYSQIAQLRRDPTLKDTPLLDKKITAIKKKIASVNRLSLKEIALPMDKEYDWDTIANKLNRRHSAQEYQSLWKLFLHPSINKNGWGKQEHLDLQKIAHAHDLQNWDEIAAKLGTNRTGYQCFVYFRTNMSNQFNGQKWSKEEEEYLKRLIDYYKEENYIPWGKVAAAMGNRTKIQIYNKYFRLVEQRKGRFLPEEDAVLLTCVDQYNYSFKKVVNFLPGRSVIQLRSRYFILKKRVSCVWTAEEDEKLVHMMANQDSNINYSSLTKHFPGKTRAHIRARYLTLLKWMKRHPNLNISKAPRRGARRLGHGQVCDNLGKAIEELKQKIQSEVNNKKKKKISQSSSEHDIEDAIVAALINEKVREEEFKKNTMVNDGQVGPSDSNESVLSSKHINMTNLQKLLILLRAKLNKKAFKESHYYDQYPELIGIEKETSLVKVKCYSKKNTVTTIKLNGTPDIWGTTTLGPLEHVIPPNYATITGCRRLMAFVSSKNIGNATNRNLIAKTLMCKSPVRREQYTLLMERFNTLFLWPMLLSNEGPNLEEISKPSCSRQDFIQNKTFGIMNTITTPRKSKKQKAVQECIDLNDHDDDQTVTINLPLSDQTKFSIAEHLGS